MRGTNEADQNSLFGSSMARLARAAALVDCVLVVDAPAHGIALNQDDTHGDWLLFVGDSTRFGSC